MDTQTLQYRKRESEEYLDVYSKQGKAEGTWHHSRAERVVECRSNGWKAYGEPVEVGCRSVAGPSLRRTFKLFGVKGQQCKTHH